MVRRAQAGDAAALDAVVRELAPYVGRICGAVALDSADDAMQETMMAIVRGLPGLRDPFALRAWARRIAVRESVRVASAPRPAPVTDDVLDRIAADDATDAVDVRAVLEALEPEQRAMLVLRHLDGLTEHEMAAELAVARGTVKSRLHRAGRAFRAKWLS
jgi:RNA polymerase sigma factor (sigma-70 family)